MLTLKSCNNCLQGMNNGKHSKQYFLKAFFQNNWTSYNLQITKLDVGSSRTYVDLH